MKRTVILLIVIGLILFSSLVNAVTLPKPLIEPEDIKNAINETGTYCYEQSTKRDEEIKVYIDKNLDSIKKDIEGRLLFFKFINSIVTFIVIFLAFFLNEFLKFRRMRKLDEISKKK